jgi:hypothetical protein
VGEVHGFIASVNGVGFEVWVREYCCDTDDWDLIWFTGVAGFCWFGLSGMGAVWGERV